MRYAALALAAIALSGCTGLTARVEALKQASPASQVLAKCSLYANAIEAATPYVALTPPAVDQAILETHPLVERLCFDAEAANNDGLPFNNRAALTTVSFALSRINQVLFINGAQTYGRD